MKNVSHNRRVFLTINSDNSYATIWRLEEKSHCRPTKSAWHTSMRAGLGPGRTPSLCSQPLPVLTATTNPDPAENDTEILLLAPNSHQVQAVHNWEALNLYSCVHTNGISWAAVQRKGGGAPHDTYSEWRQPAKQPTPKCCLLHLQTTHICC